MRVLFLCTGNAARSVIGETALRNRIPDLHVSSAGTLVVEGQPISWRTRKALEGVGLQSPAHRSRQATPEMLDEFDLVITFEPHHLDWVRREAPGAAPRTASLPRLARVLVRDTISDLDSLGLATIEHEAWEEVIDPGGGEVEVFEACARQIVEFVDLLVPVFRGDVARA